LLDNTGIDRREAETPLLPEAQSMGIIVGGYQPESPAPGRNRGVFDGVYQRRTDTFTLGQAIEAGDFTVTFIPFTCPLSNSGGWLSHCISIGF